MVRFSTFKATRVWFSLRSFHGDQGALNQNVFGGWHADITAEILNWTGHLITAPRSRLADLIQRPEATRTGVYFLTGTDPDGGFKPLVYLGEQPGLLKGKINNMVMSRMTKSLLLHTTDRLARHSSRKYYVVYTESLRMRRFSV